MDNIDLGNIVTSNIVSIIGVIGNLIVAIFTYRAARSSRQAVKISKEQLENSMLYQHPYIVLKEISFKESKWYASIENISNYPVLNARIKFGVEKDLREKMIPFTDFRKGIYSFSKKLDREIIKPNENIQFNITELINSFKEMDIYFQDDFSMDPCNLIVEFNGQYLYTNVNEPIKRSISFQFNGKRDRININSIIINSKNKESL